MAIVWDGTTNDRASTSDINGLTIDTTCAVSACGWCTGNTATRSPFGISNGSNLQFELLRRSATNDLNAFGYSAGPFFSNLALPASSSEWWFWAFSMSGSAIGNATLYVWTQGGGWTSSTNGTALQAVPSPSVITWGNGPIVWSSEMWVGSTLAYKVWNATLTAEEVYRERLSLMPKRLTGLSHFLPMLGMDATDTLRDLCQNSWSLTGTVTYSDALPPNVGYGAPILVFNQPVLSIAPTLSLPGVQDITATSARPKVTLTW